MTRLCKRCDVELLPGMFYDSVKTLCKTCFSAEMQANKRRRTEECKPYSEDAQETCVEATDPPMEVFQTQPESKKCRICAESLAEGNFYESNVNQCKRCFVQQVAECRKRRKQKNIQEEDADLGIVESLEPDSMYIMQNSRIPDEYKVGRSHNPQARAKDLSTCQNFWIQILQVYPGKGHLESTVHQRLKSRRVTACAGTEWFRVDLDVTQTIIDGVIAEHQLTMFCPDSSQSSSST